MCGWPVQGASRPSPRPGRYASLDLVVRLGIVIALVLGCSDTEHREAEGVYGVQLHLHGSLSEGTGSMLGHRWAASQLGDAVDVLWFSDHDWRIAGHSYVDGFDFETGLHAVESAPRPMTREEWGRAGSLTDPTAEVEKAWRRVEVRRPARRARLSISRTEARTGHGSLRVEARGGGAVWERVALSFETSRRRHIASLASGVELGLSVLPIVLEGDARLIVEATLSDHPPEYRARLEYQLVALGESGVSPDAAISTHPRADDELPVKRAVSDVKAVAGIWNDITLPISRDAARYGLGGADNSLVDVSLAVEVRDGGRLELFIDTFRIERAVLGQALFERAGTLAAELDGQGITHYVGQEISYAAHLNVYGPSLPLADQVAYPHGFSPREAVEFAHRHGGLASLNHIFGISSKMISHRFPAPRRSFDALLSELIEVRAYGVDLLEVGYRSRGVGLDGFLELWDGLSAAGVYVTGVGVSDSHNNDEGWSGGGNNFITWIYAESIAQADLLAGLEHGRAYFGDPTRFVGRLDLRTESGARMGDVVEVEPGDHRIEIIASGLLAGQRLRLVQDGVARDVTQPASGAAHGELIRVGAERSFVRLEVHDETGTIAVSNPIHFSAPSAATPANRRR